MHAKLAASSTTWTTGLAPLAPHFVAQISPFSVDSGAFSIVGRIRDESAVGSHGEIYRGWGARNGREKAGSWTGGRSSFAKRGATRGLPRGSPILRSDRWDVESSGGRNFAHWWSYAASSLCTRSSPRAPRRGQLGLPRWATFRGPKFRRFRWIPARFRSLAAFVMSRPWGLMGRYTGVGVRGTVEKKREAGRVGGAVRKKGVQHEDFPGGHPSYGATGGTSNLPGGVTLRTGGATPRAAYAREARRELHDVDNWACPVGPHFVAQISPFSVDSGAFSIVGRIRDESAVGSHGEIYRGWGCAERSEKKQEAGRVGGAYYSRPSTLNFGVLMGSGALVLRSDRWDVESSGGRNFAHWWSYAGEQPMHAKLAASSTTWTTGLAPLGHISWPKFHRFRWIPARFRSVGRIRDESAVGSHGEIYRGWGARNGPRKSGKLDGWEEQFRKKGCNTRTSQGVTHPSTTLAQARLTSDGATGGTSNLPGGVTLRTGGATPRAAYAREARRELHDVDNWACPRWATFRGPNFAVFGGFRRVFDRLAAFVMSRPWGLMGRYTGGLGWRGTGREKAGKLDGWEEQFAKRGATRGLPRGSPILVLLSPKHA
ncbi:UNVERIFIED_CONTAM: hypothetical protein Sindi_2919300 [Sesamum indicum]